MDEMKAMTFYMTHDHPCSYLEDKLAKSALLDPSFPADVSLYSRLIELGFRRSGDNIYRPHCDSCQACVPTRIPVEDFRPNRKQRRCEKQNQQTKVMIKPAEFNPHHFDLYQRYQATRHQKPDSGKITAADYISFLGSSWCNTIFVEFIISDKLAAVAVIDILECCLSAVYTFFDPDFAEFSPGVFAVLWQINHAKRLGLDYVYLGFWIRDCPKMNYKNQYQPLYGLIDHTWQPIPN